MQQTFIILEKDDDLRSLYRRKLERKFPGCVVNEAASCAAAVEYLLSEPVDAIVVNQAASDARGIEMVHAIRRVDTHVPLISIGDASQESASLQGGADIFVATMDWEDLGMAVEEVLNRRHAGQRNRRQN